MDTDTLGKIAETCDGRDSVSKVLSGNKVFFYDIKNMTTLIRLDNPFEDWANIYFELSSLISSEITKAVAGLKLYDNSLGSSILYQHGKGTFNVNYYEQRLSFNYEVENKNFSALYVVFQFFSKCNLFQPLLIFRLMISFHYRRICLSTNRVFAQM